MPENGFWIRTELKSPSLKRGFEDIINALDGFHVQRPDDTRPADLTFFELGEDPTKEFELVRSLIDLEAVGEIFLLSRNYDRDLLLQALRIGAKEFFSNPIEKEEVVQALERFKERKERSRHTESMRHGKIIDVIGSKGGVGTTTVAVNLAVSLAEKENVESVALVDMNMLFGDIPIFLAIRPNYDWGQITKNISRLDTTFLMNILHKHSTGVYVLPSPANLNGHHPATPAAVEHLLGLMQRIFDFVVIDGGQSIDETSLKIHELSDTIFIVSLLSLPCLANSAKLLKSIYTLGYSPAERMKVIINRYMKNTEISLKEAETSVGQEIFWTIPNDYRTTMSAINQGKSLSQCSAKASITRNMHELADSLVNHRVKEEKKGWRFLKRR